VFIDETWIKTNMTRAYGRAPRGQRLVAAVPHGHVWTPAPVQEEFQDWLLARIRLLPCVRPLLRRDRAAGPYGSSRIGSTSLERARSATHAPGSPDPVSPTLRHTYPLPLLRRRQPRDHRRCYAATTGAR
jgi:hypothetical protein